MFFKKKKYNLSITFFREWKKLDINLRNSEYLSISFNSYDHLRASELEPDLRDTVNWGRKWLVDFSAGKTQLVSFDRSNNTGAIDVKMDGSILEEKSLFKMLGLTFSSKLDWGSYIISFTKAASKKIAALICSMKFLSPELALYLYKSIIRPYMEYCCYVYLCS